MTSLEKFWTWKISLCNTAVLTLRIYVLIMNDRDRCILTRVWRCNGNSPVKWRCSLIRLSFELWSPNDCSSKCILSMTHFTVDFFIFSALTWHADFTHTDMLIIAITKTKSPVLLCRLIATILQGVNVPRDIHHDDWNLLKNLTKMAAVTCLKSMT